MITILKSGYWKIMEIFYKNKTIKLHLRELARKTKLHEPSTTKFLNNLEKEQILKSEKEGNLKKYSIKKNKETFLLFTLFDIKRFNKLPETRKKAIEYFLNKLPEKPVYAVLFGSTAKENFTKNSDIDILLITNKKIPTKEAEKEADALTAIKISTFQTEYKDFIKELRLRNDKVVQSAINSGYPLINNIQYYEDLSDERI